MKCTATFRTLEEGTNYPFYRRCGSPVEEGHTLCPHHERKAAKFAAKVEAM